MTYRAAEVRVRRIVDKAGLTLHRCRGVEDYWLSANGKRVFPTQIIPRCRRSDVTLVDVTAWLAENYPHCMPKPRNDWSAILMQAKAIVGSFDTSVTLRQLHYQLVSRQIIENTKERYTYLSKKTAEARRDGWFPALIDQTSEILVPPHWLSPNDARESLRRQYRRDRTEGQEVSIYLGVEKAAIKTQLNSWFGRKFGIPILALGGYGSQTFKDDIKHHAVNQDRPAVLIYAGDHDASGDDIYRDLVERTDCWEDVHRIALTREQVQQYNLPENFGKDDDPRTPAFMERHGYGTNVQVELDALSPDVLRQLYQDAIDIYWDEEVYDAAIEREDEERDQL